MKSDRRELHEIKSWAAIVMTVAALADCFYFSFFGYSLFKAIFIGAKDMEGLVIQWSVPLVAVAFLLLLAGWTRCSIRQLWVLGLTGMLFLLLLFLLDAPVVKFLGFNLALIPLAWYLVFDALSCVFKREADERVKVLFWLIGTMCGVVVGTAAMLKVIGVLFPLTYDTYLYKIDNAFAGLATWFASSGARNDTGLLGQTAWLVYGTLGFILFPLLGVLIRQERMRALHGWRTMYIPYAVAILCYAWLPAAGPIYSVDGYPLGAALAVDIPGALDAVVFSAPRNAMPSFHVSGAIWIFMICAALNRKIWFGLSALFVLLTAWATLALGEHYVIDLIVALPFATSLGLLLMAPPLWKRAPRWARSLHGAAGATFVGWMLLLRLSPEWLIAHPGFVQALSIWSVAVALTLLTLYIRCVWREENVREPLLEQHAPELLPKPFVTPAVLPLELTGRRWLVGIFFFSGFAGLVYEVVYAKALGVTFGGTALAANTVLMTYMGGMALGAWFGGILAERTKRPLMLYAYFEAAIGLYAIITPGLFSAIQNLYVALALDTPPDAAGLTALRMGLGVAVLGVPTVLMGATLPLVFKCLQSMGIPTARAIAPLYGANVLGAAVGALVAGYALLPAVGRNGGTFIAALVSLLIALFVIEKIKRGAESEIVGDTSSAGRVQVVPAGAVLKSPSNRAGLAALSVLMIGGVVTLALEVVFMHLLAVVAGNSVYAFGLMLATFLLGLGLGSTVGEGLMRRHSRITLVLIAQCGIALAILLTSFVWDGLANYMGSFVHVQQQGLFLSFSARELIRALVCALAMLPPAFFIGLSYPAAMGLAADWLAVRRFSGQTARGVGLASALNTLGNIAGVLLAAFWWLPHYGSNKVLFGLAITAVALAALIAWAAGAAPTRYKTWQLLSVCGMAAALLLFPTHWNYTALSTGGNVYFYPQQWGEVVDHAESVEGGMTTVAKAGENHLTLLTNGKFQGNNAEGGEMVAQESFALIPLMHQAQRNRALVIGYGTGMTARVLQDQGFARLDVAETSRDIVMMADKYFDNINAHISSHPSVTMHYTDGRNYLLTQSLQYDLISLEISSIWFAGAANLYNREFYELAQSRLRPQGVLQQWVQLHHMRPVDFLYILGSVRSVFKNVWIYVSGGQGIIVASNDDSALHNQAALEKLMSSHTISTLKLSDLPQTLVAGPQQIDRLIEQYDPELRFLVSTDKNLYLEYATPKGNAIQEDSSSLILHWLKGGQH